MSEPHDNNRCAGCGAEGDDKHGRDCRFFQTDHDINFARRCFASYARTSGELRFGQFLEGARNFIRVPQPTLFYIEDQDLAEACEKFADFLNKPDTLKAP